MKGKDLFNAMSYVEERLVNEAETDRPAAARVLWKRWMAMAACLCILIIGVVSVWDFLPFRAHRGDTAGTPESAQAQDSVMGQIPQETFESQYGANEPEDSGLGEIPSVILRVDSLTDSGFTGTVAELVDTDVIPVGTSLKVIITDDTHSDLKKADFKPADEETGANMTIVGSLICVQFVEYDKDSGTIYVNMISPVEK